MTYARTFARWLAGGRTGPVVLLLFGCAKGDAREFLDPGFTGPSNASKIAAVIVSPKTASLAPAEPLRLDVRGQNGRGESVPVSVVWSVSSSDATVLDGSFSTVTPGLYWVVARSMADRSEERRVGKECA